MQTRTDSLAAIPFWASNLIDANGNWDGECGPVTAENDLDGDEIPAACDTCPRIYNPEQTDLVVDFDADGIDDTCDFCIGTIDPAAGAYSGFQANGNVKYEASQFWDLAAANNLKTNNAYGWGPEHIDRQPLIAITSQGTITDRDTALSLLRTVWKPDACDTGPVSGADLDYGSGIALNPITVGPECPVLKTVVFNQLELQTAHSNATQSSGQPIVATVGMRFCDCPPGKSERECQTDPFLECYYDRDEYSFVDTQWISLTTTASDGSSPVLGAEWGASLAVPPPYDVFWDFTALPSSILYGSLNERIEAKGVLWTSIQDVSVPYIVSASDEERSNHYRRVVPAAYYECPQPGTEFKSYDELAYCPSCPYASALAAVEEIINPAGEIQIVRSLLTDHGRFFTEPLIEPNVLGYEAMLAGTVTYIPASESPNEIAQTASGDLWTGLLDSASASYAMIAPTTDVPSVPILLDGGAQAMTAGGAGAGLAANPTGGSSAAASDSTLFSNPSYIVKTDGSKEPLPQSGLTLGAGSPEGGGAMAMAAVSTVHDAYAFSATENYVFKLGERMLVGEEWHAFGRRLNLTTDTQDIVDFGPDGPFVVEAAVYRQVDRAIYFIENDGGIRYLSRWHGLYNYEAADAIERLAELGSSWDSFTRMWIAVTESGEVVVFGSSATDVRRLYSGAAWITLDGANMLAEAQFRKVGYAALSGMRALRDGLAFGIDATNPRVEYWGKHELGLAPQDFELTRLFDDVVLDGS